MFRLVHQQHPCQIAPVELRQLGAAWPISRCDRALVDPALTYGTSTFSSSGELVQRRGRYARVEIEVRRC